MPVSAIHSFLEGPYGLIADVKLLNFFRYLTMGGAVTLVALVVLSVFIQNFWCRYLCPYGALLGLFSIASPLRIRRSAALCIDCGKCARLPVAAAGRPPGDDPIGGVHGLHAVRCGLPGGERARDVVR